MMNARGLRSTFLRSAGAALVAGILLLPRALQAEEVSDEERHGEWDDDGERFGSIVVKGELVASPIAPGGYTLLRTYENKGDERERVTVEERVLLQEGDRGARTGAPTEPVLVRTQVLDLAPHQKKSIGTYLPAALAEKMVAAHKAQVAWDARAAAGFWGTGTMQMYSVDYLRPLAKGEVAMKRQRWGGDMMMDDSPLPKPRPAPPAEEPVAVKGGGKPSKRTIKELGF